MSEKETGGPAFPLESHYFGMTLRDWFAGQALVGFLANTSGRAMKDRVRMAYEIADAMLSERSKP